MSQHISTYGLCVAKILRGKLAFAGISQAALSEVIDVSQSQLSKILKGRRSMDFDVFIGICDALGIDPIDVLTDASEMVQRLQIDSGYVPAAKMQLANADGKLPDPIDLQEDAEHAVYFEQSSNEIEEYADDLVSRIAADPSRYNLAANRDSNKLGERDVDDYGA